MEDQYTSIQDIELLNAIGWLGGRQTQLTCEGLQLTLDVTIRETGTTYWKQSFPLEYTESALQNHLYILTTINQKLNESCGYTVSGTSGNTLNVK
tara:strand:+ start:2409 stop:2693 length:285 start_codon:yes stop_codon:yes gene_type:complete